MTTPENTQSLSEAMQRSVAMTAIRSRRLATTTIVFLLILVGALFIGGALVERSLERSKNLSDLNRHAMELVSSSLNMRRHEKDFVISLDINLLDQFYRASEDSLRRLNLMSEIPESEKFQTTFSDISDDIQEMTTGFGEISDVASVVGLDEESGLRGKLRAAAHDIEGYLGKHGASTLIIDFLNIRRVEKDFFIRKQAGLAGNVSNKLTAFKEAGAKTSHLSHESKKALETYTAEYEKEFEQFSDKVLNLENFIKRNSEKFGEFSSRFQKFLDVIDEALETERTHLIMDLALYKSIIAGLAFLLVVFVGLYGVRIIKFIDRTFFRS